ncbi:MAG: bifunctional precorrin-2 dehydrogenase/sirohydrochlorin ferrochelatase [Nitrospinota bacterium]|nr:bifunctional precorrin-2 dehydrogenase/sirohydrochlorin ferrochelatase [Nitrospinota bacterium]
MSGLYPVFLALAGKKCLVVGGGEVAARKIASLWEAGAQITVVAPWLCPEARELVEKGAAKWLEREYTASMLDGATLAIAATGEESVNQKVSQDAEARNILVNVVDQPGLCGFFVPSVVRRGDLVIAVSTSGKSPAAAKRLRKKLEKDFGPEWAVYLRMMGEARELALKAKSGQKNREKIFNQLADSSLFSLVKEGQLDKARKLIEEIVGT